jgi:hypothetical protein
MECAVAELDLISLTALGQFEDMFDHYSAHHMSVAWSSEPIA